MEAQLWASWPVGFSLWTDKDSQSRCLLEANPQSECCGQCCLSLGQTRGHVVACPPPSCSPLCLWARGSHVTHHVLFPGTCCCQNPSRPSHLILETSSCLQFHPGAQHLFLISGMLLCQQDGAKELLLPESSPQPKTDRTGVAPLRLLCLTPG